MKAFAAVPLLMMLAMLAGTGAASAHCQCVGNGTKYEQGELACLRLPNGPVLARCDKVLNNSSWTRLADGCPQASSGAVGGEDARRVQSTRARDQAFSLFDLFRG